MPPTLSQLATLCEERAQRRRSELQAVEIRLAQQRCKYEEERLYLQHQVAVVQNVKAQQQAMTDHIQWQLGKHQAKEAQLREELATARCELNSEQAAVKASRVESLHLEGALESLKKLTMADHAALRAQLALEEERFHLAASYTAELLRDLGAEHSKVAAESEADRRFRQDMKAVLAATEAMEAGAVERGKLRQATFCILQAEATEHWRLAERERTLLEADSTKQMLEKEAFERRCLAERYAKPSMMGRAAQPCLGSAPFNAARTVA